MNTFEWLTAYSAELHITIRPDPADPRFTAAGMRANLNGWNPVNAANQVKKRNYSTAINPRLIALMELETIAATPPHLRRAPHPSGCIVCPPGVTCNHPVTARNVTHPDHVTERMALLRELRHTPDMDEDEREHHMTVLINHQRGTLLA